MKPIPISSGEEWGVFNDEGCIEAQIYTLSALTAALREHADDEHAYPARMCPDHHEQPAETCEECANA